MWNKKYPKMVNLLKILRQRKKRKLEEEFKTECFINLQNPFILQNGKFQ